MNITVRLHGNDVARSWGIKDVMDPSSTTENVSPGSGEGISVSCDAHLDLGQKGMISG